MRINGILIMTFMFGYLLIVIKTQKSRASGISSLKNSLGNLHNYLTVIYYTNTNASTTTNNTTTNSTNTNNTTTTNMLIFGGYSIINSTSASNTTKTYSNTLYQINLQNLSTQILSSNNTKPTPRHSTCGIIIRQTLYIYGGIDENNKLLNQLWQYDLSNNIWSLLGQSLYLTQCQCIALTKTYTNDTLSILGLQQSISQFKIIQFDISTSTINTNMSISIRNTISLNTTTWDNTLINTFLRVQSTQLNISQYQLISHPNNYLPIRQMCLTYIGLNQYNLATDDGMYILTRKTNDNGYDIVFWYQRYPVLQQENFFYCTQLDEWYFFITSSTSSTNSQLQQIQVEYFYYPTYAGGFIYKDSPNLFISWIQPKQYFVTFIYDQAIVIMDQSFQFFYLQQNTCNSTLIQTSPILRCTFGIYSCQPNYTQTNCAIPICPGSLQLYDLNNFTLISIQCSNNGQCTINGCKCNPNWTGDDCSIFQNTNCQGQLTSNFIISNCQCQQSTTGGNQCDVVFCYNDCTGKGTCESNGICQCQDGYTGPDCSILQITFELI